MYAETVGELIDMLDQYDREDKLRVVEQPHWPLRARVTNVISQAELTDEHRDEEVEDDVDGEPKDKNVVWIAVDQVSGSGDESPYAPKSVWE